MSFVPGMTEESAVVDGDFLAVRVNALLEEAGNILPETGVNEDQLSGSSASALDVLGVKAELFDQAHTLLAETLDQIDQI